MNTTINTANGPSKLAKNSGRYISESSMHWHIRGAKTDLSDQHLEDWHQGVPSLWKYIKAKHDDKIEGHTKIWARLLTSWTSCGASHTTTTSCCVMRTIVLPAVLLLPFIFLFIIFIRGVCGVVTQSTRFAIDIEITNYTVVVTKQLVVQTQKKAGEP
jgi:hypothetical protein